MRHIRTLILWISSLALAGCATLPDSIPPADMEAGKTVAVASLLGNTFHVIRVATTVFGNASYGVQVPDWKLDEAVEQVMLNQIAQPPGARKALVLPHDTGLGDRLQKSRGGGRYSFDEAIGLAKQQRADVLILVFPNTWSDQLPHFKPGYGLYERTFFGRSQRCIYSMFSVMVLSVQTGKPLARAHFEWPCLTEGQTEIEWKESFDQYTPQEKQTLRIRVEDRTKKAVAAALSKMGY